MYPELQNKANSWAHLEQMLTANYKIIATWSALFILDTQLNVEGPGNLISLSILYCITSILLDIRKIII